MIANLSCTNCRTPAEAGDRFCQECGARLAASTVPAKTTRRFDLNSVRAEAILVAAAIVYSASVLCWFDRKQLAADVRTAFGTVWSKRPATAGGTAHSVASKTTEVERLFAASGKTVGKTEHAPNVVALQRSGAGTHASSHTSSPTATLVGAHASSHASTEKAQALPLETPKTVTSHKPDPQQLKDLAEYNRLLAEYFASHSAANAESPATPADPSAALADGATSAQTAVAPSEPPTFNEWLAGNKPFF